MNLTPRTLGRTLLLSLLACSLGTAFAQEAQIRKNLAERLLPCPKLTRSAKRR